MTLALLLALPAILLLAVTTYRQSQELFGRQLARRWRTIAWLLLAGAAVALLAGDDRGRGLIGWVCGCAPIAAATAALIGLRTRPKPRQKPRPKPHDAASAKKAPPAAPAEQVREDAATKGVAATAIE